MGGQTAQSIWRKNEINRIGYYASLHLNLRSDHKRYVSTVLKVLTRMTSEIDILKTFKHENIIEFRNGFYTHSVLALQFIMSTV